jgi:hypothetical protein
MATQINNNIRKSIAPKSHFDDMSALLDPTTPVSFNQGDLMCYDTGTFKLRPIAADADTQHSVGVSRSTVVNGLPKSAYPTAVDASQAPTAIAGPLYGVEVLLTGTAGDAVNPGALIYANPAQDAQSVTVTAPSGASHAIGHYNGPAIAAVVAGQQLNVVLGSRFPDDTLKY